MVFIDDSVTLPNFGLNIFILFRNVHLTVSIHTIKFGFERKLQLAYEVHLLQC